jgi:hypothetical protein
MGLDHEVLQPALAFIEHELQACRTTAEKFGTNRRDAAVVRALYESTLVHAYRLLSFFTPGNSHGVTLHSLEVSWRPNRRTATWIKAARQGIEAYIVPLTWDHLTWSSDDLPELGDLFDGISLLVREWVHTLELTNAEATALLGPAIASVIYPDV